MKRMTYVTKGHVHMLKVTSNVSESLPMVEGKVGVRKWYKWE